MKTISAISLSGVAGMVTIVALSACHSDAPLPTDGTTASVAMAFSVPPDYSNVSVLIQGTRDPAANGFYGCYSTVTSCFSLDADGFATSDGTPGFADLCPTNDVPVGDWTFTYTIYSGTDCTGPVLNDGLHNLVCYDISDLDARLHPNETFDEVIDEGLNQNHVACLTVPAEKTFNINVCDVLDGDPNAPGPIVLDCGCFACSTCEERCACPGYYGTSPPFPAGCQFDASCNVVCGP